MTDQSQWYNRIYLQQTARIQISMEQGTIPRTKIKIGCSFKLVVDNCSPARIIIKVRQKVLIFEVVTSPSSSRILYNPEFRMIKPATSIPKTGGRLRYGIIGSQLPRQKEKMAREKRPNPSLVGNIVSPSVAYNINQPMVKIMVFVTNWNNVAHVTLSPRYFEIGLVTIIFRIKGWQMVMRWQHVKSSFSSASFSVSGISLSIRRGTSEWRLIAMGFYGDWLIG